jgi:hypothetical protein
MSGIFCVITFNGQSELLGNEFPQREHIHQQNVQRLCYFERLLPEHSHIRRPTPIIFLVVLDFEKVPMRFLTHITIGSVVPFGANVFDNVFV